VQISSNGGAWTNLMQLQDDPLSFWLSSPAISLQAYAGQSVRVRFYFAALDPHLNAFSGWFIDDVNITSVAPPACGDTDNQATQAGVLAIGGQANGVICPGGDVDYYKFTGNSGDKIGAWTEAQSIASPLDTRLALLDSDGRSLLVSNDDMLQYQRTDSWVTYVLPRSGDYYLRVQAWDHPSGGDLNYNYRLRLVRDSRAPAAMFITPSTNSPLTLEQPALTVLASDAESGISHVQFFSHPSDWLSGDWKSIGEDWNGADGWSYTPTAEQMREITLGAVYARVYDWGGNFYDVAVWNVIPPGIFLPFILHNP
jgi:hypothetical protein